jgi:putative oxidoreductase
MTTLASRAGGVLLMAGLAVRPTSVMLALQALLAYAVIAIPRARWPVRNGGNEALLYFAAFVYLAVAGSGVFRAFDRARRHTRA